MGLLVDGVWHDVGTTPKERRPFRAGGQRSFRNWVTPTAAPGPTGGGGFKAEAGRYHLYVSLACPWAHRTLIFRALKRLEELISVSVVALADGRERLEVHDRRWRRPRSRASARALCTRSTPRPTRTIPAASPCRCCGTSSATPSSTTNRPRSSACSTAPSMRSAMRRATYYPRALRAGDRRAQRPHLRHRQQRRLQGRLCHHAGGL